MESRSLENLFFRVCQTSAAIEDIKGCGQNCYMGIGMWSKVKGLSLALPYRRFSHVGIS